MKRLCVFVLSILCGSFGFAANEVVVKQVNYAGPYAVGLPFLGDRVNVEGVAFEEKELLNSTVPFARVWEEGRIIEVGKMPVSSSPYALHLVSFYLHSDRYAKGRLSLEGMPEIAEVYVDGKPIKAEAKKVNLTLEPRGYEVVVKYLTRAGDTPELNITWQTEGDAEVVSSASARRTYTLADVFDGKRIVGASVSADGRYMLVSYGVTYPGGKSDSWTELVERTSGKGIRSGKERMQWMPRTNRAWYTRQGMAGRELVFFDPVKGEESVAASSLPDGSFRIAPTEDYLLFTVQEKGPEERKDIYEVLEPDDRQPGWRDRSFIHRYDLQTGLYQRLTYGTQTTSIQDISRDGRYLLFGIGRRTLTEQPFNRNSFYRMDLETLRVDTILEEAKFVNRGQFSPDGKQILFSASGGAFDGIGLNILPDQLPNMGDGQLFLYDPADKKAVALTRDFDPSVDRAIWNNHDNQIYLLAKDRDRVRMYTIDPVKHAIRTVPAEEDVVADLSLAAAAPVMLYYGMSASNSQRLYSRDLKKGTTERLADMSVAALKNIDLGEVKDWDFVSAAGDTIYGRYYLPPGFDPSRKYPMIVNYYGGTTPTARVLEGRYPSHVYAAMGFVVYIIQPSGATGFGQEFSARHVNTWGMQTCDEIIEGTRKFCDEHSFINREKIGCMGASYGGFTTMLLQTKTDIFAAAMSHAGISDITSYWGEGYWGYSYSGQATTDKYPWNAREIYVEQSPLFHADKVDTPILFLHGAEDTNVPVGESIQMFTALKLLGKPTALVQVDGENHHILDYDKRIRWNHTIYAWFYKWLKDDPAWWEALYSEKKL